MRESKLAAVWRALRRRILTPNISATKLSVRGFHEKSPAARELLETVGATFLKGYAIIVEASSAAEAEERLEEIPRQFRGFAYEGAGMGAAVLDSMPFGGGRIEDFLAGRGGSQHVYMAYVGFGWAMARLPRIRWSKITISDPLLRWLALDGYGFHQAYFKTTRYVQEQYQAPAFPWPADQTRAYAPHAIDQGIGRAMWFVCGTDAERVTKMIAGFPEGRRPDLYAGAGLAATYAGGVDEQELRRFLQDAGPYRAHLAQGAAFAATARVEAGLVIPHTELASEVFCGLDPARAAQICAEALPSTPDQGDLPAYEVWRRNIADELVALGGVTL